jgi:hypothetical protein
MVVSQVVIQVRRLRRGEITTWSAVLVSNTENAMEDASVNAVKTKRSAMAVLYQEQFFNTAKNKL